jgi:hypothetical protein
VTDEKRKMSVKLIVLIVIGVGILIALALWAFDRRFNPQEPIDPSRFEEARFPTVKGSNLAGESFVLPQDVEADYALLMIAFKQRQQFDINTWLPTASELAQVYDELAFFELPTIERLHPAARAFIDGGMRAGIPDPAARAATITLYLDKPAFRQALDIPDEESIVVMLIDRMGEIYWRTRGSASSEAVNELKLRLQELLG